MSTSIVAKVDGVVEIPLMVAEVSVLVKSLTRFQLCQVYAHIRDRLLATSGQRMHPLQNLRILRIKGLLGNASFLISSIGLSSQEKAT